MAMSHRDPAAPDAAEKRRSRRLAAEVLRRRAVLLRAEAQTLRSDPLPDGASYRAAFGAAAGALDSAAATLDAHVSWLELE